jgi:hypothetical protein
MMLIVFVKDELHKSIHHVCGEYVGTGILGKMVGAVVHASRYWYSMT